MVSSKHAGEGTVSTYVQFVLYMNMLLHANCSFFHLPTYYFFLWPHSIPPLPAQDHRAVSLLCMASVPIHSDSIVCTITPVYLSLYPNNLTIWSTKSTFLPLSSCSLHGAFYVRYTRTVYRKKPWNTLVHFLLAEDHSIPIWWPSGTRTYIIRSHVLSVNFWMKFCLTLGYSYIFHLQHFVAAVFSWVN